MQVIYNWERNMMALQYALRVNSILSGMFAAMHVPCPKECLCGWYDAGECGTDHFSRILSLDGGEITFLIPDDFNVGNLPEIEPNGQNRTDFDQWNQIAENAGFKIDWRELA